MVGLSFSVNLFLGLFSSLGGLDGSNDIFTFLLNDVLEVGSSSLDSEEVRVIGVATNRVGVVGLLSLGLTLKSGVKSLFGLGDEEF